MNKVYDYLCITIVNHARQISKYPNTKVMAALQKYVQIQLILFILCIKF